jgi:hypothetical protein
VWREKHYIWGKRRAHLTPIGAASDRGADWAPEVVFPDRGADAVGIGASDLETSRCCPPGRTAFSTQFHLLPSEQVPMAAGASDGAAVKPDRRVERRPAARFACRTVCLPHGLHAARFAPWWLVGGWWLVVGSWGGGGSCAARRLVAVPEPQALSPCQQQTKQAALAVLPCCRALCTLQPDRPQPKVRRVPRCVRRARAGPPRRRGPKRQRRDTPPREDRHAPRDERATHGAAH